MYYTEFSDQYHSTFLEFKTVVKENTQVIREMITYTDDYYGIIAESLPELEEKIKESLDETGVLINYFNKDESVNRKQVIYKLLEELTKKIDDINAFLDSKADLFKVLNNIISEKEGEKELAFSKIVTLTSGLKKMLGQLKVLAINSSIYTYNNYNQNGNGFNVISGKIHEISTNMAKNYRNIEGYISGLVNWHREFQDNIRKVISLEELIKYKYSKDLNRIFKDFFNFLTEITGLLEELMEYVNKTLSPVYELMVEIQNQDIMRQKLENINKIIIKTGEEVGRGLNKTADNKEIIGSFNFILEVINLTGKLMPGVQDEINGSRGSIKLLLEKVKNNLGNVQKLLSELEKSLNIDQDKNKNYIYNKMFILLPNIKEKMKQVKESYIYLLDSENIFEVSIDEINSEFNHINRFTSQLKTIKVLATIELSLVNDKNNFVRKIDNVINDLIKKNNDDIESYMIIQKKLKAEFDRFRKIATDTNEKMETFNNDLKESEKSLKVIERNVSEKVSSFGIQIDNLRKLINYLIKRLDSFDNINKLAEKFKSNFKKLKSKITGIKGLIDENDLETNNYFNNERLKNLFHEFTSFQERKMVSDEYKDMEIDVGDSGGELTLF